MSGRGGGGGKRQRKAAVKVDRLEGLVLDEDELEFKAEIEEAFEDLKHTQVLSPSKGLEEKGWSFESIVKRTKKRVTPACQLVCLLEHRPASDGGEDGSNEALTVSQVKTEWERHMYDVKMRILARKGCLPRLAQTLCETIDVHVSLFRDLQDAVEMGLITVEHKKKPVELKPKPKPKPERTRPSAGSKRKR